MDPEIESAIDDMAIKLEAAGARLDTTARPHGFDFAKADRTFRQLIGAALCLPIGLQVVGPYLEDRTCLAAAAIIEAIGGGTRRPPGW